MTKTLKQIIEEQVEEFESEFCFDVNKGTGTQYQLEVRGKFAELYRDFLRTSLEAVARQTAENLRGKKKAPDYYGEIWNAALIEIEAKEKEFFKDL